MAAINKRTLLVATFIALRERHRRRRERERKKIGILATSLDRLVSGAFYSAFLVAKSHDRKEFITLVQLISMFHIF